jgi:hydrogenase expression/formation protein HypC
MCLAVPGKILSIDDSNPDLLMARVQFGNAIRDICIQWVDDVEVGDYILAHVGTALSKIDEADAQFTLDALREMGAPELDP